MRYAIGVADSTPPVPDAPTDIAAVQDAPLDAPDALNPSIIEVDRIPLLQGFVPPPETVTKTGTPLVGDESPSGKVRVRTRYPVDIFDSGTLVVTAEGVKVDGAKLDGLVKKARESGIELERI